MAFDEQFPHADVPEESELPTAPPPPAESPLLFTLGVWCLLLVVVGFWVNSRLKPSSSPVNTDAARVSTFVVEMLVYQQHYSTNPQVRALLAQHVTGNALAAANAWVAINNEISDPADAGATRVNAAALYGVAGHGKNAREQLARAARRDPAHSALYRKLTSLYNEHPQSIILDTELNAFLQSLSTGPLLRFRAAELAHDKQAAKMALTPGYAAGLRVSIVALVEIGVLLLAFSIFLILLARRKAITTELRAADGQGPPMPWNIGTALILVSAVYLLDIGLSIPLRWLLEAGHFPQEFAIIPSTLVLAFSALAVLSTYLWSLGKPPWAWEVFGWRRAARGMGYGLLALLLLLPIYLLVSALAAWLFRGESNTLIETLQQSRVPWLQIYMLLTVAVLAPVIEETLFRGILFRAVNGRLPFWSAAFVSAAIFASIHGQLVALLPIGLLGLLLAFLTRRTDSLLASAAAHGVFNAVNALLALLIAWMLHGPGG